MFWLAALAGLAIVAGFTLARSGGSVGPADAELLAAILLCALGYAEGGGARPRAGRRAHDLLGARARGPRPR